MDEYLRAVGRVSVNFNQLEGSLGFYVQWLLDSDFGLVQAVKAGLRFDGLMSLAKRLVRWRYQDDPGSMSTIMAVLDEAIAVKDRRNAILHSSLLGPFEGEPGLTTMRTTRSGVEWGQVQPEDIEAIAGAVRVADQKVMDLARVGAVYISRPEMVTSEGEAGTVHPPQPSYPPPRYPRSGGVPFEP
jgi:hypothetical protein